MTCTKRPSPTKMGTGPGITLKTKGILTLKAFERFWRGDTARSAAGIHCGLGLSLVKKAAAVLGGSVSVQSEKGGLFEITVTIPEL